MSSAGTASSQKEEKAMESLARYIIQASFSQERMQYLADEGTVIYSGKDGKDRKVFDAPEWLAAMCSHVPNRGEQMVRYYGWYSNVARGKREKLGEDDAIPHIIESDSPSAASRKSWARLIQKIYEVDPLICPKCRGNMDHQCHPGARGRQNHPRTPRPLGHPIKTSYKGSCAGIL
jgi:hypothetical protein